MDAPVLARIGGGQAADPEAADLEVVIPLWNEEQVIEQLHARVAAAAGRTGLRWRVTYVDDGSVDGTAARLRELVERGQPVRVIRLARNFGQPAAIQAGLRDADAAATILMDGDLQDPPELIPELVTRWRNGAEVVIARRTARNDDGWLRGLGIRLFHRLFGRVADLDIPGGCGTYCLMGRRAVAAIRELPEAHRFFPGLRAWVGFRQDFVDHVRLGRSAGRPKQGLERLVRYAADAVYGYSRRPVRWIFLAAAAMGLFSVTALVTALAMAVAGGAGPGAVAGMVCGMLGMMMTAQMAALGWLGGLGVRIYEQSKQRPAYLVESVEEGNPDAADNALHRAA